MLASRPTSLPPPAAGAGPAFAPVRDAPARAALAPRPAAPPAAPTARACLSRGRRRHRGLNVSGSLTATAKNQVIECTALRETRDASAMITAPMITAGRDRDASARRAAGKLAMITALRARDDHDQ